MFEGLLLPWQQIYHLVFNSIFRTTPEVPVNFTFLKYVKSQRSYGFLITKELIFGFQILDLNDHFSASLTLKVKSFICYSSDYEIQPRGQFVQYK